MTIHGALRRRGRRRLIAEAPQPADG
jgi:hypothetical protein